jgi:hypothetical protein
MPEFAAKALGGPCDGDEFRLEECPRDGDTVDLRMESGIHTYAFKFGQSAWIYRGVRPYVRGTGGIHMNVQP